MILARRTLITGSAGLLALRSGTSPQLLDVGDRIILNAAGPGGAAEGRYPFADVGRSTPLLLLAALFAAVVIVLGRLRGLLALSMAVAAATAMVIVNTVVYVRDVLGGCVPMVTIAYAASGGGSMLAALLLPRVLGRVAERTVMLAGGALMAIGMAAGMALSGTGITTSASAGCSRASCRPMASRASYSRRPPITLSGRAR